MASQQDWMTNSSLMIDSFSELDSSSVSVVSSPLNSSSISESSFHDSSLTSSTPLPRRRGRPPGSRNHSKQLHQDKKIVMENENVINVPSAKLEKQGGRLRRTGRRNQPHLNQEDKSILKGWRGDGAWPTAVKGEAGDSWPEWSCVAGTLDRMGDYRGPRAGFRSLAASVQRQVGQP